MDSTSEQLDLNSTGGLTVTGIDSDQDFDLSAVALVFNARRLFNDFHLKTNLGLTQRLYQNSGFANAQTSQLIARIQAVWITHLRTNNYLA